MPAVGISVRSCSGLWVDYEIDLWYVLKHGSLWVTLARHLLVVLMFVVFCCNFPISFLDFRGLPRVVENYVRTYFLFRMVVELCRNSVWGSFMVDLGFRKHVISIIHDFERNYLISLR